MSDQDVVLDEGPAAGETDGVVAARPSVKEGMSFAAASFVVNAVLGLASAVLTSRLYGVEIIGEYALVTAPWLLLVQFSSVGEQVALTKELAVLPVCDPRVPGLSTAVLGFSFLLTGLVAAIVAVVGVAGLRGPIGQPELVGPALVIVLASLLVENTSWNVDSVLSAFRAGRELFWARLTQVGSFIVLAALVRPAVPTVWGLVHATVASFVLALGVRVFFVRRYTALVPSRAALREGIRALPSILSFSARLVPSRFIGGITSQAPTWILGAAASVSQVGAFSRASSIAVRMNDAGYRVSEILFPALVERHEAEDRHGFHRTLDGALRLTSLALLAVAAAGGGAAFGVMDVFGEGFSRGSWPLALLLTSVSLTVVASVQASSIIAVGRPGLVTWLTVVRTGVAVPAMLVGVHLWSATGVAAGLLLASVAVLAAQAVVVRKYVGRGHTGRHVVAVLGAYVAGFAVAHVVDATLGGVLGTAVALGAGVVAYGAAALALGGLHPDDRERIEPLLARIRRGR